MARNQVQFQKGLSEASFAEIYGTEEQCHAALVKWRWPNGFECPGCNGADHCVVTRGARRLFQCKACRKQTSVKAGTIFASSKLPLRRLIPLTQVPLDVVSEAGARLGRVDSERGAVGRGRTLAEFQREFPDEASCAAFLSARRWPDGFVCPACGRGRAAALKSRPRLFECLDCGRQTSLTAGTAMHRSKLPLTTWFWAAHLMATHSNGMSARQLQDQLGVTYKTAWLLAQKLRRSMVDPDRNLLEGVVEVDKTEIS